MDRPVSVALVTGGAHGIGAAIAARLARDGWRVVVADRDPRGVAPPGGRYVVCDVADEAAVGALIAERGGAGRQARRAGLQCGHQRPQADRASCRWRSGRG